MVKEATVPPKKPHPLAVLVGENIVRRRKLRNLTQEVLADLIGVGQQSLSRMEKGRIEPQFDRLQKLADALHCPIHELFQRPAEGVDEKAAIIKDIIAPLSVDAQGAVINILAEMAREIGRLERKYMEGWK